MLVREWARRLRGEPSHHVLEELAGGKAAAEVAREQGLPLANVQGLVTFYELLHRVPERACAGTACRFAGGHAGVEPEGETLYCLGHCYAAPARTSVAPGPIPRRSLAAAPVVLRNLLGKRRAPAEEYELPDGPAILAAVTASGLRGRGGAAFPTGKKWRSALEAKGPDRFVVVNGDEGDPGSYVDRLLLEEDPHAVLAGVLCCARAIQATRAVVFIRGEYPRARASMEAAIAEAEDASWLGELEVAVVSGAGSYVAGEETALIAAIEGGRSEPRPKPPYPTERGLFGCPTAVQNVETIAAIPALVRSGLRGDSKAFCLSGAVREPGVVEARLGIPLAELIERGGGGVPAGRRAKLALVGGPMGCVVPATRFEQPLSYDALPGMGHGGIVVLDQGVGVRELFDHLATFARTESCGSCAPCRIGTARLGSIRDRPALDRLLDTLELGSLCGFGQGVPRPIRDLLQHFPEELLR